MKLVEMKPVEKPIEVEEEEVHVCAECYWEIQRLKSGDEGWNFCENCQLVEGDTTYVKQSEVEPL